METADARGLSQARPSETSAATVRPSDTAALNCSTFERPIVEPCPPAGKQLNCQKATQLFPNYHAFKTHEKISKVNICAIESNKQIVTNFACYQVFLRNTICLLLSIAIAAIQLFASGRAEYHDKQRIRNKHEVRAHTDNTQENPTGWDKPG